MNKEIDNLIERLLSLGNNSGNTEIALALKNDIEDYINTDPTFKSELQGQQLHDALRVVEIIIASSKSLNFSTYDYCCILASQVFNRLENRTQWDVKDLHLASMVIGFNHDYTKSIDMIQKLLSELEANKNYSKYNGIKITANFNITTCLLYSKYQSHDAWENKQEPKALFLDFTEESIALCKAFELTHYIKALNLKKAIAEDNLAKAEYWIEEIRATTDEYFYKFNLNEIERYKFFIEKVEEKKALERKRKEILVKADFDEDDDDELRINRKDPLYDKVVDGMTYKENQFYRTEFGPKRLRELRQSLSKKTTAAKMSLDLGKDNSYIRGIESGDFKMSQEMFHDICFYLNITPRDFYDEETKNPPLVRQCIDYMNRSDDTLLESILAILKKSVDLDNKNATQD